MVFPLNNRSHARYLWASLENNNCDAEFECGAKVIIVDGALDGYNAIFVKKTGTNRVSVLFEIVGKNTRIQIPPNHLETC